MANDPLFREISDPIERKRALAENIGLVIDEVISTKGMDANDLANKLNYVRRAVKELQAI